MSSINKILFICGIAFLIVNLSQTAPRRRAITPWNIKFTRPDNRVGELVARLKPGMGNPEELGSYYEGDIMMSSTPLKLTRNGVDYPHLQWTGGVVPYVIGPVDTTVSTNVKKAMSDIQAVTCVKFIERTTEADYIYIQSLSTGCWSYVGRKSGMQEVNFQSPGCTNVGTMTHELMHALGFFHEHTRDDRDQYVKIEWANIQPGKESNFDIWPYNKNTYGVGYDYGSILHYSATSFSSNGLPTIVPYETGAQIGQRRNMTSGDITRINGMYKCQV